MLKEWKINDLIARFVKTHDQKYLDELNMLLGAQLSNPPQRVTEAEKRLYPKGTEYVFEVGKPPKQVYTLEEILAEL